MRRNGRDNLIFNAEKQREGTANMNAYALAKKNEGDANGCLFTAIANIYTKKANEADVTIFERKLNHVSGFNRINAANLYARMLAQLNNTAVVTNGLDVIKQYQLDFNNGQANGVYINILQNFVGKKKAKADAASDPALKAELEKQAEYANRVIDGIRAK